MYLCRRLSLHKVSVSSLSFSSDNKYLVTLGGRDDNSIVVWDVVTGTPICGSPAATDTAHSVSFFNNSNLHLISAGNYHVRLWQFDLANKKVFLLYLCIVWKKCLQIRPTSVNTGHLKRVFNNVLVSEDDSTAYCGTQSGDILEINLDRALYKKIGPPKVSI